MPDCAISFPARCCKIRGSGGFSKRTTSETSSRWGMNTRPQRRRPTFLPALMGSSFRQSPPLRLLRRRPTALGQLLSTALRAGLHLRALPSWVAVQRPPTVPRVVRRMALILLAHQAKVREQSFSGLGKARVPILAGVGVP